MRSHACTHHTWGIPSHLTESCATHSSRFSGTKFSTTSSPIGCFGVWLIAHSQQGCQQTAHTDTFARGGWHLQCREIPKTIKHVCSCYDCKFLFQDNRYVFRLGYGNERMSKFECVYTNRRHVSTKQIDRYASKATFDAFMLHGDSFSNGTAV